MEGDCASHLGQAITKLRVHEGKGGLCHCILKDEANGGMQDFCVVHNVKDLLQQAVKVLRRELVQNALHLPRRLHETTFVSHPSNGAEPRQLNDPCVAACVSAYGSTIQ